MSLSLLFTLSATNHLDLEAVLWLEKYLTTKFKGTLMVVSHDRHFLNEIVTDVVHFHRSKLITYRGDISNFEAVRDDDKLRQQRQREIQETKRAHLQKYIDLHAQSGENGVKASKQRKSKMKKLDKLGVMAVDGKKWKSSDGVEAEEVEEYQEEESVTLNFPDPGLFVGDIVRLDQVQFGYSPDKLLLHEVDLTISMKSRVALLGRNGSGKSTLIKLVVGALQALSGKVTIDARAKIEYLAQHQLEQLDPDGTPIQTMIDRYPGDHSNTHIGELRRYLANFGLGGEILPGQKIHTMSGGQKCRLCLASAMYRKPHLLILDERKSFCLYNLRLRLFAFAFGLCLSLTLTRYLIW
jgi:ATP-binding cassette subfamily F protein 3